MTAIMTNEMRFKPLGSPNGMAFAAFLARIVRRNELDYLPQSLCFISDKRFELEKRPAMKPFVRFSALRSLAFVLSDIREVFENEDVIRKIDDHFADIMIFIQAEPLFATADALQFALCGMRAFCLKLLSEVRQPALCFANAFVVINKRIRSIVKRNDVIYSPINPNDALWRNVGYRLRRDDFEDEICFETPVAFVVADGRTLKRKIVITRFKPLRNNDLLFDAFIRPRYRKNISAKRNAAFVVADHRMWFLYRFDDFFLAVKRKLLCGFNVFESRIANRLNKRRWHIRIFDLYSFVKLAVSFLLAMRLIFEGPIDITIEKSVGGLQELKKRLWRCYRNGNGADHLLFVIYQTMRKLCDLFCGQATLQNKVWKGFSFNKIMFYTSWL